MIHPSRTAPKCAHCRHAVQRDRRMACDHPSAPQDLVAGLPAVTCEFMRSDSRVVLNHTATPCGTAGALFAPLDNADQILSKTNQLVQGTPDVVLNNVAVDIEGTRPDVGGQQLGMRGGVAHPE